MARQARAEVTRSKIIDAAADLFDKYGYAATSLSDIIARAGVTKGALYCHFSSKQELGDVVVAEQHSVWISAAREFASSTTAALPALLDMSFHLAGQLIGNSIVRGGIRLTLE
jgi:TetR/AcrR family transcriptional regulator, repressor for uid operon